MKSAKIDPEDLEFQFALKYFEMCLSLDRERILLMKVIPWWSRWYLRDLKEQGNYR